MQQKLTQLTGQVWLWPHNPSYTAVQSSVGVIHCGTETVLVDAGNGPGLARRIKRALSQHGFPLLSRIIYTHHHWDHTYGACEFQVPVVAHAKCKSILTEAAKKPWSAAYLRQQIESNPELRASYTALERAVRDWKAFHIVVPETVFERSLSLQCGRVRLELEHVGGRHAEDSIVVKVPEAGVMFLGDCYYPPPLHLQTSEPKISMSMLEALESEAYSLYVGGHAKPITREDLCRRLERHSRIKRR
jgi:glyoxylase-like metal-dependent hydrolase (beta-lactamase superfamily II)